MRNSFLWGLPVLAILGIFSLGSSGPPDPSAATSAEQTLKAAGVATDGASLLEFFRKRSLADSDRERIRALDSKPWRRFLRSARKSHRGADRPGTQGHRFAHSSHGRPGCRSRAPGGTLLETIEGRHRRRRADRGRETDRSSEAGRGDRGLAGVPAHCRQRRRCRGGHQGPGRRGGAQRQGRSGCQACATAKR